MSPPPNRAPPDALFAACPTAFKKARVAWTSGLKPRNLGEETDKSTPAGQMMTGFQLDPRLAADSLHVAELEISTVRLMNDRRYPWAVLVPRRAGAVELHDLSRADRALLVEEVAIVSRALSIIAAAHKMNVAALGNIVRQLHIHVVARREVDGAWPQPIWGRGEMSPYSTVEGDAFAARLAAAIKT